MSNTTYTIAPGENLIDVAINHYGSAAQVFQLMEDNPQLEGADQPLIPGTHLQVSEVSTGDRLQAGFSMANLVNTVTKPAKNEVLVKPGQSLTDIVIEEYGDLSYIFQLLEDNPHIQGADSSLEPGTPLYIDHAAAAGKSERKYTNSDLVELNPQPLQTEITIYAGQSVMDLALQEYGDIAAAIDMLIDSGTDDIGTWVPPSVGTYLSIRKNRVFDTEVTEYYHNRNIRINTGRKNMAEGIGLCSSDGVLLISFDNFILKASDQ